MGAVLFSGGLYGLCGLLSGLYGLLGELCGSEQL